jgi:hypothetical protein
MDPQFYAYARINGIDAEMQPRDFHQSENFALSPDHMPSWGSDQTAHAERFAAFLRREGYSPAMVMGAIGAVAEMTAAHWVLVDGHPAELAVARIRNWRKAVLGLHPSQTGGFDDRDAAS